MAGEAKIYRWPAKFLPADGVIGLLENLAKFPALIRRRGMIGMVGDYGARRAEIRRVIGEVDHFLLPSQFLYPLFAGHGLPVEKLQVLEWGIDTSWYRQSSLRIENKDLRMGYIGQIASKKGVHILLESFNRLNGLASLSIYGDDTKEPHYYQTLASIANHNPRIRFSGGFDHSDLEKILSEIDVLVAPSLWHETFCITVREALIAGVPVIGANLGGIPDAILHGENGLLFAPGDVQALTAYLQQLIDDPDLLRRLKNVTCRVKSIDEEAVELEKVYSEQLSTRTQVEGREA